MNIKKVVMWSSGYVFKCFLLTHLLTYSLTHCLYSEEKMIQLPQPKLKGTISLEETIFKRRSVRNFQNKKLTPEQISQLLWSAQGLTSKMGFRSAPSAGAIYPVEIYFVSADGIFHYIPQGHKIEKLKDGDLRTQLSDAAYGQEFISDAGISVIICCDYEKIMARYSKRGIRYADMEAGHIAQNIHLQAVALGLGSVPVGAFLDTAVTNLLNLPKNLSPIYIIPVGYLK
ncbi:MAG: SagB/ThcOx family dehydrogenase [Elusimicrobiota bacterium]